MSRKIVGPLMAAVLVPGAIGLGAEPAGMERSPTAVTEGEVTGRFGDAGAAQAVIGSLGESLRGLATEILRRNPEVARAQASAIAAESRAPQARSLADPMAQLTFFALPPETRVGPQRLNASLSQRFPWFGTLELRERAALLEVARAQAELEAVRLETVTEARRLVHELAFLDEYLRILRQEREHLLVHEEAARVRYTAGSGLQQGVVRIQAAITRTEGRIVAAEIRIRTLVAALNRLRDEGDESWGVVRGQRLERGGLTLGGGSRPPRWSVASVSVPELRCHERPCE